LNMHGDGEKKKRRRSQRGKREKKEKLLPEKRGRGGGKFHVFSRLSFFGCHFSSKAPCEGERGEGEGKTVGGKKGGGGEDRPPFLEPQFSYLLSHHSKKGGEKGGGGPDAWAT